MPTDHAAFSFINNAAVIIFTIIGLFILFSKRVRTSLTWHAAVTPLASIIGSGFLVSAPLLMMSSGKWAAFVMIGVVTVAYFLGHVMRYNISYVEPALEEHTAPRTIFWLDQISHPILGVAYVISVAFYLKLLSAFVLWWLPVEHSMYENMLTTAILILIGMTGKFYGLNMLENYEIYAVNIKLAVITSMLIAMLFFNIELSYLGKWEITSIALSDKWTSFRQILGILIIVQGFETSRYLGMHYSTDVRNRTMKLAQWIAAVIYVVFIALALTVFNGAGHVKETAIIDLSKVIAPVLPAFLVVAAVMSQFSAAVADTIGSGGLLVESVNRRLTVNTGYLIICMISIVLTWLTNVFEIVVIASKAFALYYASQTLTALAHALIAHRRSHLNIALFIMLFILMMMVVMIGIPVE